jgi:hypothetical protein
LTEAEKRRLTMLLRHRQSLQNLSLTFRNEFEI